MKTPLFGIDLGGTKIEGVVLQPDGVELLRHRIETPRGSYSATLDAIARLVTHLETATGKDCARLGVGIPGSVTPEDGLIRNGNSTWLNGQPMPRDLKQLLKRPVRLSNDANCLALSESRDGAAAGAGSVFAVILGTGVGGGLVINGHLVEGAHGLGGEWGHIPLPGEVDGPACYCGRNGCVETFLAGPSIVAAYISAGGEPVGKLEDIAARAEAGERLASTVLDQHLDRLGRGLCTIVNVVDPEVIVLGGGVSNLPGLVEKLPRAIQPHIFAVQRNEVEIDVRQAHWGGSSGVRGAAWLWENSE